MADVEEPKVNSLAERIAALNQQKNFQAPETKPKRPPPPPPPTNRPVPRSQTLPVTQTNGLPTPQKSPSIPPRPNKASAPAKPAPPPLPRRTTDSSQVETTTSPAPRDRIAPPPLPTRSSTQQISPALPPRRPSTQQLTVRRNSNASEISNLSSLSLNQTVSSATSIHSIDGPTRKLPPTLDQAKLPPLPPTKREREAAQAKEAAAQQPKFPLVSVKSSPAIRQIEPPQRPILPPRLTSKSTTQQVHRQTLEEEEPAKPRRLPPPPSAYVKPPPPTTNGHTAQDQQGNDRPPLPGRRPTANDDAPPPVPLSSRPSAAQIEAVSARVVERANDCLICRDFSGPDGVAAQYPIHVLPRNDPVGYLAQMLCGPFASHTDKARAIFTWFHHNIAYDCAAFFGNNIRGRSGAETILMGKAVCSGYADTYREIATRAGLKCITVVGHGKGYGYTALKKGERPPPKKADGHAWNAVRIDGGEWKLLDACWGAGNVSDVTKDYTKSFKPHEFTRRNDIFGLSHYPSDDRHFFRPDGRVPSWEEYYIGTVHGDKPIVYTHSYEEGVWDHTVEPKELQIPVYSGQVVRFQWSNKCEHWTSEKHGLGKPPLLFLSIKGRDGRKDDMVPIQTDGFWHWADVNAIDLGAPGQSVSVAMITSIDGQDARGMTADYYFSKKGRCGMAWTFLMKWELI